MIIGLRAIPAMVRRRLMLQTVSVWGSIRNKISIGSPARHNLWRLVNSQSPCTLREERGVALILIV